MEYSFDHLCECLNKAVCLECLNESVLDGGRMVESVKGSNTLLLVKSAKCWKWGDFPKGPYYRSLVL